MLNEIAILLIKENASGNVNRIYYVIIVKELLFQLHGTGIHL